MAAWPPFSSFTSEQGENPLAAATLTKTTVDKESDPEVKGTEKYGLMGEALSQNWGKSDDTKVKRI